MSTIDTPGLMRLLRRDVQLWNEWREAHLEAKVSFRNECLSHLNLIRANFTGIDLAGVNLSHSDLSGANLVGANHKRADFSGAK
ncbi:MAG: pentapeptide repeat-containing protein, partial [Prochlorotrichaceae cyanobacterium]